ncbi:HAD family hydrolase [Natrarchaeobius halalkaliphilus]|uniref:HAD family hydrolase n=1 Tax=Natrarchaeobius halalkaliphilus TaxID=1679091 RepID=A0A3N6MFL4_9EURY|nr:HAD hydrolase-like protein [Natrarchaeobius halalkaliphilus]RQG92696.1 HAD family hydrolase [Natrarchaeobius halalkaliphilus]
MGTNYDAVVFDNDGVLTTPTDRDVLLAAIASAFDDVGVADPPREHVETLLGPTLSELRRIAAGHEVDPATLWTARERAAVEAQLEEILTGRKRRYDDVEAVDSIDVPTAIVSNNQHRTIANILEHCELDGFEVWYGREPTLEGIERKKPAPYYLERAIDDLGATDPLYVGDSPVDVVASEAAGVDVAFVRRDHRLAADPPTEPQHDIDSLTALPELL